MGKQEPVRVGAVDTLQAAGRDRVGTSRERRRFYASFFFFHACVFGVFFFQAARRDVSRLRLKRRFASRPPTNPRTLSSKKRMIGQAFDLASRFVSKTSLMLFVLAFWALLLYSWYRSF